VRVSELEGALLDYWVARAGNWPRPRIDDGLCWIDVPACDGDPAGALDAAFSPSSDWEVAGPIIERTGIGFWKGSGSKGGVRAEPWEATTRSPANAIEMPAPDVTGPTPLIAAMRAFVRLKFGDEVEDASQSAS
jgi:hypothetical protein